MKVVRIESYKLSLSNDVNFSLIGYFGHSRKGFSWTSKLGHENLEIGDDLPARISYFPMLFKHMLQVQKLH